MVRLALGIALTATLAVGAQPAAGNETGPSACVVLAGAESATKIEPGAKLTRRQRRALAPMTRPEIDQLMAALEPVKLEDGSGFRIRGMEGKTGLRPERLGVLLSDVTSILAYLSAREQLAMLDQLEDVPAPAVEWTQAALKQLMLCVPAQFERRGGETTFRDSLAIVDERRSELERLVFLKYGSYGGRMQ